MKTLTLQEAVDKLDEMSEDIDDGNYTKLPLGQLIACMAYATATSLAMQEGLESGELDEVDMEEVKQFLPELVTKIVAMRKEIDIREQAYLSEVPGFRSEIASRS